MAKQRKQSRALRGYDTMGTDHVKRVRACKITPNSSANNRVSMFDVRKCAEACGSHWFDADSMRFFKSRVGDTAYHDGKGGALFVSSEKGPSGTRRYSVRYYNPRICGIDTVGEFQAYGTATAATTVAKRLANSDGALGRARKARK